MLLDFELCEFDVAAVGAEHDEEVAWFEDLLEFVVVEFEVGAGDVEVDGDGLAGLYGYSFEGFEFLHGSGYGG